MSVRVGVTVDCADPDTLAVFWSRFLGYGRRSSSAGSPYVTIERPVGGDGPPQLVFQRVPESKVGKARLHLDLFVEHASSMLDEMVAEGATVLSRAEAGEWTTRVLQDPEGNEFCLIGPD